MTPKASLETKMNKTLRINFELDHIDNPPLYDELAKFAKGPKRVSRLRTLAHAGLIAQKNESSSATVVDGKVHSTTIDPIRSAATLELFGPSAD
jgi:hypothetical protein